MIESWSIFFLLPLIKGVWLWYVPCVGGGGIPIEFIDDRVFDGGGWVLIGGGGDDGGGGGGGDNGGGGGGHDIPSRQFPVSLRME